MPLAIPIVIWFMDPFQWFFVIVMKSAVAHAFASVHVDEDSSFRATNVNQKKHFYAQMHIVHKNMLDPHPDYYFIFISFFVIRKIVWSRLEANAQHFIIICNRIVWPMTVWPYDSQVTFVRARAGSSKFEKVWQRCPVSTVQIIAIVITVTHYDDEMRSPREIYAKFFVAHESPNQKKKK